MSENNPYGLKRPCDNCPFRNDIKPYLRGGRVREIEHSLERGEFPCHKTTEHDEDGDHTASDGEVHCAGALILMMKEGRSSQMMRISHRIGLFDPDALDMGSPVYDSFDEMAAAQEEDDDD